MAKMRKNSFSSSYSSYSGQDLRVIVNGHQIGSITSLRYNIEREKSGNYVVGNVDPISFARGRRSLKGEITGLVLDVDFLKEKAFDGEIALLDNDETWLQKVPVVKTGQKAVTKQVQTLVKKYPNLKKPDPILSKWEYFMKNFVWDQNLINFDVSVDEAIENCLDTMVTSTLETIATTILSGGVFGVPAIVELLQDVVVDCLIGLVVQIDFEQIGINFLSYINSDIYESYLFSANAMLKNYELKANEMVAVQKTTTLLEDYEYTDYEYKTKKDIAYDVNNLSNNYRAATVEYVDQILPFDIVIIGVNEYGQSAQMRLYGCELLGESKSLKVDQLQATYTIPFVFRAILPWRSFELEESKALPKPETKTTKPEEMHTVPVEGMGSPIPSGPTINIGQKTFTPEEIEEAFNPPVKEEPVSNDDLTGGNDGIENTDSDNDGLADVEEEGLGTDPNNPDTDGDGIFDYAETQIGTNPLDPDSDGDGLNDFVENQQTLTDPNNPDSDGDKLNDWVEVTNGTDPLNSDTDGDGISDYEEINITKTLPTNPDSDGDGINDGQEIKIGTDPKVVDTDGDGYSDKEEMDAGYDPLDPNNNPGNGDDLTGGDENPGEYGNDEDGDGLTFEQEVNIFNTDPNLIDTDGDQLTDGQEVARGTDPNNPDTDGDGYNDADEIIEGSDPLDPQSNIGNNNNGDGDLTGGDDNPGAYGP